MTISHQFYNSPLLYGIEMHISYHFHKIRTKCEIFSPYSSTYEKSHITSLSELKKVIFLLLLPNLKLKSFLSTLIMSHLFILVRKLFAI